MLRWILAALFAAATPRVPAPPIEPIVYTVRVSAPATHIAEIEVTVPTNRRATIELMLPNWSPGYYSMGHGNAGLVRPALRAGGAVGSGKVLDARSAA